MNAIRLTPAAQDDLDSIWEYTVQRWGPEQAEAYLEDMGLAVQRIAANPRRGQLCEGVRFGYRRYGIGSHLIYYFERVDHVDVIRILHGRMDPTLYL